MTDGGEHTLTEALTSSKIYVVLATKNYLLDIESGDNRIIDQITMMKALKKPVLILWVVNAKQQLDEAERRKLMVVFKEFEVREAEFDVNAPSSGDFMEKLQEMLA